MNLAVRSLRLKALAAGISAVTLLLAVAVPHQHEGPSLSHPQSACRACRLQDGFTAAPAAPAAVAIQPARIAGDVRCPADAPFVRLVLRPASSRAPPIHS